MTSSGCASPDPFGEADDDTADDDDDDDSTSPASSCRELSDPDATFGEIEHEVNATIPTVVTVRWSPEADLESWVWFGADLGNPRTAPSETVGADRGATLLGLRTDSTYSYRVVADTADGLVCTDTRSVTTGSLAAGMQTLSLPVYDESLAAGGYTVLVLSQEAGAAWIVILDHEGEFVWFKPVGPAGFRARLSLDRKAILVNDPTFDPDEDGQISRIPLDGAAETVVSIDGAHTDFAEIDPGLYATFGWDLREYEDGDRTIAGETIVEASAGGGTTVVWSLFDDLEPDLTLEYEPQPYWTTDAGLWAHLNHLHYAPEEDAYYVTSRFLGAVHRIERAAGSATWVLAPGWGDFQPAEGSLVDFSPHSAVPTDEGVLLFDTSSQLSGGCSAASEFRLDSESWTAEHTWIYATEDCLLCYAVGNSEELWNGNRTLVLSVNGQIDETTRDGELVWRLTAPFGCTFAYATRFESFYP